VYSIESPLIIFPRRAFKDKMTPAPKFSGKWHRKRWERVERLIEKSMRGRVLRLKVGQTEGEGEGKKRKVKRRKMGVGMKRERTKRVKMGKRWVKMGREMTSRLERKKRCLSMVRLGPRMMKRKLISWMKMKMSTILRGGVSLGRLIFELSSAH
jgi:hypothetical protein